MDAFLFNQYDLWRTPLQITYVYKMHDVLSKIYFDSLV